MTTLHVRQQDEHDGEPVHGLPAELPAGETIVWQGAPHWPTLAVQAFHLRKVALYFGVLLLWRALSAWHDGGTLAQVSASMVWPLPLAAAGLGLLAFLAWLTARTTVYTLTNRRVVMRVGIVLTVTFNLPLSHVDGAQLRRSQARTGDICLQLRRTDRIAYLHLWPHVRPWRLAHAQPMLRAVPQADRVARQLAQALQSTLDAATAAAQPLPGIAPWPKPDHAPQPAEGLRPLAA